MENGIQTRKRKNVDFITFLVGLEEKIVFGLPWRFMEICVWCGLKVGSPDLSFGKLLSRNNEQSWADLRHICDQYFTEIEASLEISFYGRKSVENSNFL